jgi:hypothetical protein
MEQEHQAKRAATLRLRTPTSLQVIERYKKIGNEMLVDVTWYDPVAFAFPLHGTSIQNTAPDAVDAWKRTTVTLNECASSNLVYHDEHGLLADFEIDDPRYRDLFDQTPWTTVFKQSEKAKLEGKISAAPSSALGGFNPAS